MAKIRKNKGSSPSWDTNCERLLLYADIMGFSSKVTLTNHLDLQKQLVDFNNAWKAKLEPLKLGGHLRSVQFSDSILIVVNGIDEKMVNLLTKAAISLMQISLKMCFPMKGVIAQGQFTYDKNNDLFFGLPLVDAYNLHEEIYYYGIVVHNSAEKTIKDYMDASKPYGKGRISLKKGKTSHYNLCWHLLNEKLHPQDISKKCNEWLDVIEESVSGDPRIYVDNTRDFIKEVKTNWIGKVENNSLD